ncbi:UDP-glycosyltransferase 90A1-like [Oryza brachyantha]|uniref:Glycosyltransferase n=1 Tax=Oryza brachyantha TaxID=4533 RepID=J3MWK9_ORYBR|nr:UDP-glycosyltransferase 90A1-like [Oryza brachyantha]
MAPAPLASGSHGGLPHVAIFPFMAKGHTIPLIQLVNYLRHHQLATVTFFTTPGNAAFVRDGLSSGAGDDDDDDVAVVELEFPVDAPGIPPGVESAEGLASMVSFVAFTDTVSLLRPQFEASVAAMRPPASFIVADAFLYWVNESAARLGVPKVSFFGISTFSQVMRELRIRHDPCAAMKPGDVDDDGNPATFTVPEFPHIKVTFEDLMATFGEPAAVAMMLELDGKLGKAITESHGLIINTFHGLEAPYIEFWNDHVKPRAWAVGPLCLAQPPASSAPAAARPSWMQWLDKKAAAGRPVLYVALGTLAAIPELQLREVADGLEQAQVDFIWAVRPKNIDLGLGFEERTMDRGLVVREWVDQLAILRHESVGGFVSHCGWNSVLESVAAGVPLAVWPMLADQPFNARFLADELRIAVRVSTSDGTMRGLVPSEEISRVARELMSGEVGAAARKRVVELSVLAKESMVEGGRSWVAVKEMISELCAANDV